MPMKKLKEPKPEIKCHICGDRGLVKRAYLDPTASLPRALDLVRCRRCTQAPGIAKKMLEPFLEVLATNPLKCKKDFY